MFKLWFIIEYGNENKDFKGKLTSYLKFGRAYILPSLIFSIWAANSPLNYSAAAQLQIFAMLSLLLICITHFTIQKLFFSKLEKDVLIKFLPDKIYPYVRIRLLMLLLKWNLPIILTFMFYLRDIFVCTNLAFYFSAFIFVVIWVIVNYLVAISLRYIKNTVQGTAEIIFNVVTYIFNFIVLIVLPLIGVFKFLDYLSLYLKGESEISYIYVNAYMTAFVVLVLLLALVVLRCMDNYLSINIRKIVINKVNNKEIKTNSKLDNVVRILSRIVSFKPTDQEQELLIKDIKNLCRENIMYFSFFIISGLVDSVLLIYIYLSNIPKNFNDALKTFTIIQLIVLIFMIMFFVVAKFGFRNYLDISKDIELLDKFAVNISKASLIKSKRLFAAIVFFLPIMLFYIVVFAVVVNMWSYLTIILSLICTLIIKEILNLILVKMVNNENSDNTIINMINLSLIGALGIVFNSMYTSSSNTPDIIKLYIAFIVLLTISYFFNLKINVVKDKKENI